MQIDAKDITARLPVVSVTVVVPTYNERENIERLVPQLLNLDLGRRTRLSVCVVDDHSPDGTGAYVDRLASTSPRVSVVHRAGKLGLGTAYVAGMRHSMSCGADAVLTMDADFSHHPRYIPAMVAALPRADLVIGSRYISGGAVLYPLRRRLLSRGANAFARLTLGLSANDCTAGFRLYRREVLASIDLDAIFSNFSNGYSFLIEMLFAVQQRGWQVSEVPIIFEDRQFGQSKISRNEILKAIYTCSRLLARRLIGSPMRTKTEMMRSK
jgi:glycosyltransferase involved in cell wall biosynthesis